MAGRSRIRTDLALEATERFQAENVEVRGVEITKSGFVSETKPRTISRVSIPVCAITPGTIPLI